MINNNSSPVTVNAEQATTYAVEENVNLGLMEPQGSVTPGGNCNARSNPTVHVPLDKCLCGTYLSGTRTGTIPVNPNLKEWNGEPLQEDVVYHRNHMMGLPECTVKENRDPNIRGKYWRKVCRETGMVSFAIYVKASVVKAAGFTPAIYLPDKKSWWIVPNELLSYFYVILDGNGRAAGHNLDLMEASKNSDYQPFDFKFVFQECLNPKDFFNRYLSANNDVKKTTSAELMYYTACHDNNSDVIFYRQLINEGFVAKAATYYVYGKELSHENISKIGKGEKLPIDQDLVSGMRNALAVYRSVFSGSASAKVLKGVPLAQWTYKVLKNADDKPAMSKKIEEKFSRMSPQCLSQLQDAKGTRGDKTKTLEIILIGIFNRIMES